MRTRSGFPQSAETRGKDCETMGGRGSRSSKWHFSKEGRGNNDGSNPIHTAGMNRDIANGVTPEKTLNYLEKTYKKGMTREQVQILDDYGFVMKAYQGTAASVKFDLSLTKGRIYTHNHPGRWGGTFSEADISSMIAGGKEIRASAAEGVYSLRATKKANAFGLSNALTTARSRLDQRMSQIAQRVSRMKIANPQRRATIRRRLQLGALDRWYRQNAEAHGFVYQFERNRNYKI